jgi:hypothetical protein
MTIANDFPHRDSPTDWRRQGVLLLPLVVAAILAAVGAFGSYVSMSLPLRLLHFATVGLLVGALAAALSAAAQRYLFRGRPTFLGRPRDRRADGAAGWMDHQRIVVRVGTMGAAARVLHRADGTGASHQPAHRSRDLVGASAVRANH